jgi:hypothetical protein
VLGPEYARPRPPRVAAFQDFGCSLDDQRARGELLVRSIAELDGGRDGLVRAQPRIEEQRDVAVGPAPPDCVRRTGERADHAEQRGPRTERGLALPPEQDREHAGEHESDRCAGEDRAQQQAASHAGCPAGERAVEVAEVVRGHSHLFRPILLVAP